eukprot:Gb_07044 [translate_table: standard]
MYSLMEEMAYLQLKKSSDKSDLCSCITSSASSSTKSLKNAASSSLFAASTIATSSSAIFAIVKYKWPNGQLEGGRKGQAEEGVTGRVPRRGGTWVVREVALSLVGWLIVGKKCLKHSIVQLSSLDLML